jgi:uncharacterized protein (DUF983 family)
MLKGTKLYSILYNKCPKCHEGEFFVTKNPYNFKKFDKLQEKCNVCGEIYEKENGFYYGAMYVSYGLAVLMGIAEFLFTYFILGLDEIWFLGIFVLSMLTLWTILFRKARIIYINLFVKYKKQILKTN